MQTAEQKLINQRLEEFIISGEFLPRMMKYNNLLEENDYITEEQLMELSKALIVQELAIWIKENHPEMDIS